MLIIVPIGRGGVVDKDLVDQISHRLRDAEVIVHLLGSSEHTI
jgi:hypothetical protein